MIIKKSYWLLTLIIFTLIAVIGVAYLNFESSLNSILKIPKPTTPSDISEKTVTISGYVVNGGDTTPEMLMDTPRKYVYVIKKYDGSSINITYTAYPPSPIGDKERNKIRLSYYNGTIGIGDYLIAQGSYDKESNTLIIAKEGDYIETFLKKP